ncbi:MAG: DUF5615 family PIN-like protein [Planctomycetia bacterium]|nr:DUF5615 family PIN-like protein [Planctomycetia bacterium]
MARNLKFHLDENMGHVIAQSLLRRGIDTTSSKSVDLLQADDHSQIQYCLEQNRVLVTCDHDFVFLHQQGTQHQGIVIFKDEDRQKIGPVVRFIELMWEVMDPDEVFQQLIYA